MLQINYPHIFSGMKKDILLELMKCDGKSHPSWMCSLNYFSKGFFPKKIFILEKIIFKLIAWRGKQKLKTRKGKQAHIEIAECTEMINWNLINSFFSSLCFHHSSWLSSLSLNMSITMSEYKDKIGIVFCVVLEFNQFLLKEGRKSYSFNDVIIS